MKKYFLLAIMTTCLSLHAGLNWPVEDAPSVEILNSLPVQEYETSFHIGGTGYLDGVRPSNFLDDAGAFAFEDTAGRTAVSIRYEVVDPKTMNSIDDRVYVSTLFQRYTDNTKFWVFGGHFGWQQAFRPRKLPFKRDPLKRSDFRWDFNADCGYVDGSLEDFTFPSLLDLLKTGSVEYGSYSDDKKCISKTIIRLVTSQ